MLAPEVVPTCPPPGEIWLAPLPPLPLPAGTGIPPLPAGTGIPPLPPPLRLPGPLEAPPRGRGIRLWLDEDSEVGPWEGPVLAAVPSSEAGFEGAADVFVVPAERSREGLRGLGS
jgi:hypothetical protein